MGHRPLTIATALLLLGSVHASTASTPHHWSIVSVDAPPLVSVNADGSASGYLPGLLQAVRDKAAEDGLSLSFEFHPSDSLEESFLSLISGSRDLALHNELLSSGACDGDGAVRLGERGQPPL